MPLRRGRELVKWLGEQLQACLVGKQHSTGVWQQVLGTAPSWRWQLCLLPFCTS